MKKIQLNIFFPICIFALLAIGVVSFLTASPAFAQGIENPLNFETVPELIGAIIRAILALVGSATLLMLVWGGFVWLTAAGEEKRIKQGTDTIVWAIFGLGIIFGAYLILNFIIKGITDVPPPPPPIEKAGGEQIVPSKPEAYEETLKTRLYDV